MRAVNRYLFNVALSHILTISYVTSALSCKRTCSTSDNGILKFQPGYLYEYSFDSILTVDFGTELSTDRGNIGLNLVGIAKIFAEGNCGYTLQLNNVKVSTTKGSIEKKIVQNIQKPVYFTLTNGKLEPQLCSDLSDTQYSLNIKRGLISLLQYNADDGMEVDVFGQCLTHTTVSKSVGVYFVNKIRDLRKCAHREILRNGWIQGAVNQAADIKSTPITKANYAKELKISNGIVEYIHLVENYAFGMAENYINSVRGKIVTNLKVKNPVGIVAVAPKAGTHGVSIIFQRPEVYKTKNFAPLKALFTHTVDLLDGYVKKDSANAFLELIRIMRSADTDTLLEMAAVPHQNTILARKVYFDVLFRTGTTESAKAILRQLSKMNEKEKTIAIASLALIQTVDKDTLTQAITLLVPNAPKQIYISVGTLIAKYCKINGCDDGDLAAISKKFVDNLKHCKAGTKKDEDRIVNILKGITNMGHITMSLATALAECATSGHAMRIRIAALQAFASDSCEPILSEKALALLRDRNDDSEVRIEAYLAAIKCPSADLAAEIAEIVNSEQVYQVGGFIASNLQAIRHSTDDYRVHQRFHLGNIRVTKKFPVNAKRYSYNNEVSYKLDSLGLSASSDYQLIYSLHGFLPRSAKLNITIELFGTHFNVFELGARQENLEKVLEYYLGPKGLLNKDFGELLKMIEISGVSADRTRRSIADDTAKFSKKYKAYGSKAVKDVNLDFSFKFFGSELFFLSIGDYIPSSLDDILKHFSSQFSNVKREISSFNKEFTFHDLFLDLSAIYPTGLGIPLEFNAQCFAANKLDFGISLDVDAINEDDWLTPQYRLKLVPSIDITLKMQLGINAYVLTTGLQLKSSLHSVSGGDVKLNFLQEGNGFNLHIETPLNKLNLMNLAVNPEFYVAELDKPTELLMYEEKSSNNNRMCINQLESMGLNLCMDVAGILLNKKNTPYTAELKRLILPVNINVYIEVQRKYHAQGLYLSKTKRGSQEWKLDMNSSGSNNDRFSSIKFELGSLPQSFVRLAINSPICNFAIESGLNNDEHELVFYAQYENSEAIKRNRIGFIRNGNEFRPIVEIWGENGKSNEIIGHRMDGKIILLRSDEKEVRYIFENIFIANKANQRIVINGWIELGSVWFKNELFVGTSSDLYLVKGNLKLDNGVYDIELFTNEVNSPDSAYGGSVHVQLTNQELVVNFIGILAAWEIDFNNMIQYALTKTTGELSSSSFKHDINIKKKQKVVSHIKLFGFTSSRGNLELKTELLHGQKAAAISVKYNGNRLTLGDYIAELHCKYDKHSANIIAKSDFHGDRFVIDNTVTTSWGTMMNVKGEVGQLYTAQDIYIDLKGLTQLTKEHKKLQWSAKMIGVTEKFMSEIKIFSENIDFWGFNGELNYSHDKLNAGKINIFFKNTTTVIGDFRTAKNGNGDAHFSVELLKPELIQKLNINSTFQMHAPKYEIEGDIFFNGKRHLLFKTANYRDETTFTSKNIVEISNKTIGLDAHVVINGDFCSNGDLQGHFVLTYPTEHVVEGNIKCKVNGKKGHVHENIEVKMSETHKGKIRTVAYQSDAESVNLKTKERIQNMKVIFTDFDNKNLELVASTKHLPSDQSKSFQIQSSLGGDFFNIPATVIFLIDEHDTKNIAFEIDLKFGGATLASDQLILGGETISAKVQGQSNNQPKSNIKAVQFSANGKLIKPSSSNSAYVIELHVNESVGDQQFFRWNTILQGTKQDITCALDWETEKIRGPFNIEVSYRRNHDNSAKASSSPIEQHYLFKINYDNKFVKMATDLSYNFRASAVHYSIQSSFESAKNVEFNIHLHKLQPGTCEIEWQAKSGEKIYSLYSKTYQSESKKGIDMHIELPGDKPLVVVGVFEILDKQKSELLVVIKNIIDIDFFCHAESFYKAIEDFYIKAKWNSTKLGFENYNLDVHSHGKSIVFNMEHERGMVFTGSTTFLHKKENGKSIIEGEGLVQYNGTSQKLNFRLIHKIYDLHVDKEIGFMYSLDSTFGPKKGVSTLKITNKDMDIKLSICEEKKQCTDVQVQSSVSPSSHNNIEEKQHYFLVVVDLRELGYPYEFELQSKTIYQGLALQYSLETQIVSINNLKYKLSANVLPTTSYVQLKMPKREIFLEAKQQFPTQDKVFGHYESSIAFYFDKTNKPNDVTRIETFVDVIFDKLADLNIKSAIKFEHPTIRPLVVSGNFHSDIEQRKVYTEVVFDIFSFPNQQIINTLLLQNIHNGSGFNVTIFESIRSAGFDFNYELSGQITLNVDSQIIDAGAELHGGASHLNVVARLYATKDNCNLSMHVLNEPFLLLLTELNSLNHGYKMNCELQLLSQAPLRLSTAIHPTESTLTLKQKNVIDLKSDLKFSKDVQLDIQGFNKQLLNGRIELDADNFLRTTYISNNDEIKSLLNMVEVGMKRDTANTLTNIKSKLKQIRESLNIHQQLLKDSTPDLSKLKNNYKLNIHEIVLELENDHALKKIVDVYRKIYNISEQFGDKISHSAAELYKSLHKSVSELIEQLGTILKDAWLPTWENFIKTIGELKLEVVNQITIVFREVLKVSEQYAALLKTYGKEFNEVLKPLIGAIQELVNITRQAFDQFAKDIREFLYNLPSIKDLQNEFKKRVKHLRPVDNILEFLNIIFDRLHILPHTKELREFIEKLREYVESKLTNKVINDEHFINELTKLLIKAVHSMWINMAFEPAEVPMKIISSLFDITLESLNIFENIPRLLTVRFSVLNFLLNENLQQIFNENLFKSLIFYNDFSLRGHIADGHQIVTFDGQHFSFPGSCKYILTQDSVDNNFTVVAQLNNGKLKNIFLTDRDGSYAEITDSGVLKINGNQAEFPQHINGMHAWRLFYTVWLYSEYGIEVMCTQDLRVCHFKVNGFYTSKTRGLLGNGNTEPYDDFLHVDGTIAADFVTHGNGYGIGKCAPITLQSKEAIPRSEACSEIFGLHSPLKFGYLFENTIPYRARCDAAVAEASDKEKEIAACTVARAYGSALNLKKITTRLPSRCLSCSGGAGQRELGQKFTIKVPLNKADVIFVVDMNLSEPVLSKLVAPIIVDIRDFLKTRGFNDVQIGVIAYNESQLYPALLTNDGGKINYQSDISNVQLNGPKKYCMHCAANEFSEQRVTQIVKSVEFFLKSIIPQSDEKAFRLALNFPFRAGAAKSIIGIRSNTLEFANMFKLLRSHLSDPSKNLNGALMHIIGPVKGLSMENISTEKLVGFNPRLVATLDGKDAKKRQKLKFEHDIGIDFVLSHGGWVFATQNFDQLRPNEQKKALNQIMNTLADTLFRTEIISECICETVDGLNAQHQCVIKSSSFLPNKKIKI